jgi:polysaccharide biosynthesis protein PslH
MAGGRLRPRVLFLACHLPFPPLSGGRRRELELIKRVSRDFDVHLLAVSKTFEQDRANAHQLEAFCERVEIHEADGLDGHDVRGEAPKVRRHRSAAMTSAVRRALARDGFDLVHVEGFYLMQHLPPRTSPPVLLVEQNIEYELEPHDDLRGMRTLRAEVDAWRRAALLGVVTPEDRDSLLSTVPGARVRVIPDGADHLPPVGAAAPLVERPGSPLLVFTANFGYPPNVDAALHLCEEILPAIRRRVADVQLWLVGTDPPAEVLALAGNGVTVTGRVPEVVPYIDAADVLLCPLRVGGGVKVKAIEALRRGKALVTTSVGAQGLHGRAREALTIADDSERFAEAAAALLLDAGLRRDRERRSAAAAATLPTWDEAADMLSAAYEELLALPREMAVGT